MRRIPVFFGIPLAAVIGLMAVACAPPPAEKAVVITSPKANTTVKSPLLVTGTASLSHGDFHLQILDAANHVLVDQSVLASCASPCRGTFSATLSFLAAPGTVRLYAYRPSPK